MPSTDIFDMEWYDMICVWNVMLWYGVVRHGMVWYGMVRKAWATASSSSNIPRQRKEGDGLTAAAMAGGR